MTTIENKQNKNIQITKKKMRQRLNKTNDKNTNDTSKKGRHDEIEKLKEKGIIGGILHLITLIFNFYALISCVSALYDYINGTHKSEDVDLFKTILPQFVAVMVGIVSSPLAMRVVNRTYEDNINLCSDSEQAHKCFSQVLKCCFNSIIFIILYQLQYMFTIDELLLSKKNNINNGIGLFNCIIIGFGLFLFLHLYRTFVLGEPYKHQKETSMYNPYQAFITNNKSYSMIVTVSIVCKIIQASIILPICDEMLFRMFFYHRMNIIFLNEGGNGYITYIVGSRHGNLLIALITSLLFNAYNADKKVDKKHYLISILPGIVKGMVLHIILFSSTNNNGIGMGGNVINCIIVHSCCNFLLCLIVLYKKQFWLWP